ncbi:MAG: D-alanyl-D-alanine carboxypeptidase/D-alanyl-D-alanine-endopeptidase [Chitinophagaceae bacterium]
MSLFRIVGFILLIASFGACSTSLNIGKAVRRTLLADSVLQSSHVGVVFFDPSQQKEIFSYNGQHYFTPASNTKIITCYAAMKLLGDSLPGLLYAKTDEGIYIRGTGDPTLLQEDYRQHPVLAFLRQQRSPLYLLSDNWHTPALGRGWSWEDYNESYMTERSAFPVYGNVLHWYQQRDTDGRAGFYSVPPSTWDTAQLAPQEEQSFSVERDRDQNRFTIRPGKETSANQQVPFCTNGVSSTVTLLRPLLGTSLIEVPANRLSSAPFTLLRSQPTDSLLRIMMFRSDNFFADQSLLMVSQQLLGKMDEQRVIDTLLHSLLADLPQQPVWVDGSGLSRYNLFSPRDIIRVLEKMQAEFPWSRLQTLFPTGGQGSLSNLYLQEKGAIYAKTGTLGGVVALSGYLQTRKGKWILFSILVNHHTGSAAHVRQLIQRCLRQARSRI